MFISLPFNFTSVLARILLLTCAVWSLQVGDPTRSAGGYTSAAFHPDGHFLGTGTSRGLSMIWDVADSFT